MASLIFITHPEVVVDAQIPVTEWGLNDKGRARASRFSSSPVLANVTALWASAEVKAKDTAQILGRALGLSVLTHEGLGENDRTATGFIPPDQFEKAADAFFSKPETSFKGWERAVDAQARIQKPVSEIISEHEGGDVAIVSHGAVGTLLYCALAGFTIDRVHDQPSQGHYWIASLPDLTPVHPWKPID